MIQLTPTEARALGTLIEKAATTPGQYPLTLNALVVGCNQKNNRDPVSNYDEDTAFDALDSLRRKLLASEVHLSNSRVPKFRHNAAATMEVSAGELAILAELWLRGPQSAGELRSNAQRMTPIPTLEACLAMLDSLAGKPEPLVERLPRRPGERAERWAQRMAPYEAGAGEAAGIEPGRGEAASGSPPSAGGAAESLLRRVDRLETEIAELREVIRQLQGG